MKQELVEVTTAVAEFDRVEAGIAELRDLYTGLVYDVTCTAGMKDACAARAAVRAPRYEVERVRKAAKAPILELGRALDARAKAITEALLAIETPIDNDIKAEQERKESERAAKEEAERLRVTAIQNALAAIRGAAQSAVGQTAADVALTLQKARETVIAEETYEEFTEEAGIALGIAVRALERIHGERVEFEAEQARQAEERARLEAAEQEAAAARMAAQQAAEAERAELEAERGRIAAEREELERLRAAPAVEPQPAPAPPPPPEPEPEPAPEPPPEPPQTVNTERTDFRVAMGWFAAADPFPGRTDERVAIEALLDAEAERHGFSSWEDAHRYPGELKARKASVKLRSVGG